MDQGSILSFVAEIEKRSGNATQPLTRARGEARVGVRFDGNRTALRDLRQSGSAKILLPDTFDKGVQAVVLNTAGGITGGDRFAYTADAGADSTLVLTSQAAERAYRARGEDEPGRLTVTLSAEAGATLAWLPQETILFDGAALSRKIVATCEGDARLLLLEACIIGRTAMGETVSTLNFTDRWDVFRDGMLVYADALRIDGDAHRILSGPATLNGSVAFANLIYSAPDAEAVLADLRPRLPADAASSLVAKDVLSIRFVCKDGLALRRSLLPILRAASPPRLPKVWML